jgi:hypothetical protein
VNIENNTSKMILTWLLLKFKLTMELKKRGQDKTCERLILNITGYSCTEVLCLARRE